jgi:hypothetical protein
MDGRKRNGIPGNGAWFRGGDPELQEAGCTIKGDTGQSRTRSRVKKDYPAQGWLEISKANLTSEKQISLCTKSKVSPQMNTDGTDLQRFNRKLFF